MLFFEYSRPRIFWILWMFKYSRLWWSHPCHWCCPLNIIASEYSEYLNILASDGVIHFIDAVLWSTSTSELRDRGNNVHIIMFYVFFLTLLFTFWQQYKSCTSTSGSIISYQVRCKCVTLWQVGLFWSQNVFNYVMLGCLVSGLWYLFICPLNSNRMPISYEMKTSLFQNCV